MMMSQGLVEMIQMLLIKKKYETSVNSSHYLFKCELKCHLAPTIKAWGMGKDTKKKIKKSI
jgi:hypothetical protein